MILHTFTCLVCFIKLFHQCTAMNEQGLSSPSPSPSPLSSPSPSPLPSPEEEWNKTWHEFKAALGDISQNFDQFYWMRKLFSSGTKYIYHKTKLSKYASVSSIHDFILIKCKGHLVQFVPLLAICLVCLVVFCYDGILHDYVIRRRWCIDTSIGSCIYNDNESNYSTLLQGSDDEGDTIDGSSSSFEKVRMNGECNTRDAIDEDGGVMMSENKYSSMHRPFCFWSMFHLIVTHYLCFMILWNYLHTTFTSPGVLVPQEEEDRKTCNENNDGNGMTNTNNLTRREWKSTEGRGGCCYINPKYIIQDEINRVALYKDAVGKECFPSSESNSVFIPAANTSFCKKCQMDRPPRCHHCSTCNRCVLQVRSLLFLYFTWYYYECFSPSIFF